MVLFMPIEQELDCINGDGLILGKIKFDGLEDEHKFEPADESVVLSDEEQMTIAIKLAGLNAGNHSIPMQDED